MRMSRAFTLVELLVVMAIIAVLVSVLMPALQTARQMGQAAKCLHNVKSLSLAWFMYQSDHEERLFSGWTNGGFDHDWVKMDTWPTKNFGLDREKDGIRRGALFPYVNTVEAYHCPGDRRAAEAGNGFRTYSVADCVSGVPDAWQSGWGYPATRFHQIGHPAAKYVFVEESDPRGYNWGTWVLNPIVPGAWVDPLAIWHYDRCILGFTDGHAEIHPWLDESTIYMCETQWIYAASDSGNPDLKYMIQGWNVLDKRPPP